MPVAEHSSDWGSDTEDGSGGAIGNRRGGSRIREGGIMEWDGDLG